MTSRWLALIAVSLACGCGTKEPAQVEDSGVVDSGVVEPTFDVTVTSSGNAAGFITSNPQGIACPGSCSRAFKVGTQVTLSAEPAPGATFVGWGGACSGTSGCVVSDTATVTAMFALDHTLVAFVTGDGSGSIVSTPAGINCGQDCDERYSAGTQVTLAATPVTGSNFIGWTGACSGTNACTVTVEKPLAVGATFSLQQFELTVTRSGTGDGVVNGTGIDCGVDCTETYGYGTAVVLTATASTGSDFTGWSGGGCSGTGTCTTTLTAAAAVTANFTLKQYALTITSAGTGSGTVTSSPSGISCGSDCTETFDHGTQVTLSAVAAAGSKFAGWSGGGCSGTADCVLDLMAADTITATFNLETRSAELSLVEVSVLNPGTSGTFYGQGVQAKVVFSDSTVTGAPVMEEQPGSPIGCKAWSYTPSQYVASIVGSDEGPVQVSLPNFPVCAFQAGSGYSCPHNNTFSTGGIIGAGPQAGTATLTDLDITFNGANTTNRYVYIAGATTAANNGFFPILGVASANTIVYANPGYVAETLPNTAVHANFAGVGPTPSVADPGFLDDTTALSFSLTAGGGNNFPSFTATTTSPPTVGDDFNLGANDLNLLNAIPKTGNGFGITCDGTNCPTGSANATVLELVTTDAPTTGLSPFSMPTPTTKSTRIRCVAIGTATVSVPAAYSALIQSSGATRIQATFSRVTLMTGGPSNALSYSGHAIRGFTN